MEAGGNANSEQKYDVEASTTRPALQEIPGVERVSEPVADQLEAVYFDTPTLTLAARRITLRRRTGGTGDGWHLTIPAGPDRREELHAPLGQPDTVPEELTDHLQVYARGERLVAVVRLRTQRTTLRLYGTGGEHLADFVDGEVHAQLLHPPRPGTVWREWEVEPVHGTQPLIESATDALTAAGAERSRYSSQLERALGGAWPAEFSPRTEKPRKKGPAADVVTAYLDEQITQLLTHDPGVRLGRPDAVHQMRSATRRARSVLATFRKLFDKSAVKDLEAELKWLGRILGPARDAEVMLERLRRHILELPGEQRSGPFQELVERELVAAHNAGYKEVLTTMGTGRYYRVLGSLEDFRDHAPARPKAFRPARKLTAELVDRAARRVDSSRKSFKRAAGGTARDTTLHQVRKDAKRLRYAAESVTSIHGKSARTLAKRARRLQKVLGDHQDSIMASAFLRTLANTPGLPAGTDLVARHLLGMEERLARKAEKKYRKAGKKLRGLRLRP